MVAVDERLWRRVEKTDDCWEWQGYRMPEGYGQIRVNGQQYLTHRLAYELAVGPIPEGLQIDHLCRNRACCNPDHLEAVTSRENTLRGESRAAVNARKTQCPQGHPYEGENLYVSPSGERRCRSCGRAHWHGRKRDVESFEEDYGDEPF